MSVLNVLFSLIIVNFIVVMIDNQYFDASRQKKNL